MFGTIKKERIRDRHNYLSIFSHSLNKGFTLIELMIIFLISSVVVSIGVNSFTTYSHTQTYNQALSDVISMLKNTRSRAISQVKPAGCGANPLLGFEVEFTVPGRTYRQNALCGASRIMLSEKNLPSGINFVSSSSTRVFFEVAYGTVRDPIAVGIGGLGNSKTVNIDGIGIVTVRDGVSASPAATSTPGPSLPAATGSPSSVVGYARYSDGTFAQSGAGGSVVNVFAIGAAPNTTFNLIAGTSGVSGIPCSQSTSVINGASSASGPTGFIGFTTGSVNLAAGTWQICFRQESGASVTSPVTFTVTSSTVTPAANPTPTPTGSVAPPSPTATSSPTQGPTGSTAVSVSSITPNPATRSSAQSMSFTASVTGSGCTPAGTVEFFRNSETVRFTAGSLSGSNPASATGPYNSGAFTVGTHQIYARFVPNGGSCPTAESSRVNLTVN